MLFFTTHRTDPNPNLSHPPALACLHTGNFGLTVALEWLQAVIPDVAPKLDEGAVSEEYWFKNTYSGALAMCKLEANMIIFESQSVSTVATFKEGITRQANFRRTQLEEATHVSVESVHAFLELFREKFAHQLSLVRKHTLIGAIKEVAIAENAGSSSAPSWLQGEYLDIHKNSDVIEKEFKGRGLVLDYITTVIANLHVDFNRLQGYAALANPDAVKATALEGSWDEMVKMVVALDRRHTTSKKGPIAGRRGSKWSPEEEQEEGGYLDEDCK